MRRLGSFRAYTLSGSAERCSLVFDNGLVQLRPSPIAALGEFGGGKVLTAPSLMIRTTDGREANYTVDGGRAGDAAHLFGRVLGPRFQSDLSASA